ncbi:hypothetical protein D3C79_862160 [compost metagenome]
MALPLSGLIVTVGLGEGPLPVVLADSRQLPPDNTVAVPRLKGPLLVDAVTARVSPIFIALVPTSSQAYRLLLRMVTLALITLRF